jgi:ribA/ribD-fused uncharacterized protein
MSVETNEPPEVVAEFRGAYRFLSNFWPSPIEFVVKRETLYAPTVEHAFQALKSYDLAQMRWILDAASPGEAKRRGRQAWLRQDWDSVRVAVMDQLLGMKFVYGSVLADQLLATGVAELIEGNTWGDQFWGVCDGVGENWLGQLLMRRRAVLRG